MSQEELERREQELKDTLKVRHIKLLSSKYFPNMSNRNLIVLMHPSMMQSIEDIEADWIKKHGPPPKPGYHVFEPMKNPFDRS